MASKHWDYKGLWLSGWRVRVAGVRVRVPGDDRGEDRSFSSDA